MEQKSNAYLETALIGGLMRKYSIPCIISLLVSRAAWTLQYVIFFIMMRSPPRCRLDRSSAASEVYKSQPPYQIFRPEKPMNARAIRPAVTRAMGKPSQHLG